MAWRLNCQNIVYSLFDLLAGFLDVLYLYLADRPTTDAIPEPPAESILREARLKRKYDKMMWDIFKEIFVYICFLCLICFIAWGAKDDRGTCPINMQEPSR